MLGLKILIPPRRDCGFGAFASPAYRQEGLLSNPKEQTPDSIDRLYNSRGHIRAAHSGLCYI